MSLKKADLEKWSFSFKTMFPHSERSNLFVPCLSNTKSSAIISAMRDTFLKPDAKTCSGPVGKNLDKRPL